MWQFLHYCTKTIPLCHVHSTLLLKLVYETHILYVYKRIHSLSLSLTPFFFSVKNNLNCTCLPGWLTVYVAFIIYYVLQFRLCYTIDCCALPFLYMCVCVCAFLFFRIISFYDYFFPLPLILTVVAYYNTKIKKNLEFLLPTQRNVQQTFLMH